MASTAARKRTRTSRHNQSFFEQLAADRKLLTVPAATVEAGKLAARYTNDGSR